MMDDTTAINRWLEGYIEAWSTDAPEDVARLFAADALYYTTPFSQAHVGVEDIVRWWREQGDSGTEWTFVYDAVARERDLYVVRGVTRYPARSETEQAKVYHNIWLVTLDDEGRATEFVEYWMLER